MPRILRRRRPSQARPGPGCNACLGRGPLLCCACANPGDPEAWPGSKTPTPLGVAGGGGAVWERPLCGSAATRQCAGRSPRAEAGAGVCGLEDPRHLLLGDTSLPASWRRGGDRGSPSAGWSDGPPAAQPGKCRLDCGAVAPGTRTGTHTQEVRDKASRRQGAASPPPKSQPLPLRGQRPEHGHVCRPVCEMQDGAQRPDLPTGKEPTRHRPPRSRHTSPGAASWALTCPRRP